jgi:hypothetical protein
METFSYIQFWIPNFIILWRRKCCVFFQPFSLHFPTAEGDYHFQSAFSPLFKHLSGWKGLRAFWNQFSEFIGENDKLSENDEYFSLVLENLLRKIVIIFYLI